MSDSFDLNLMFNVIFLKNADYQLTQSDLQSWEEKHGKIPDDVILLVFTNWGKYWPNRKAYLGTDTKDTSLLHFPGMCFSTYDPLMLIKVESIRRTKHETYRTWRGNKMVIPTKSLLKVRGYRSLLQGFELTLP